VLLIDDEPPGSRALAVRMDVAAKTVGSVLRLTAGSPSSTGPVLLGGHAVSADGSWHGPRRIESAVAHAGVLGVTLAPSSAALLTVGPPR